MRRNHQTQKASGGQGDIDEWKYSQSEAVGEFVADGLGAQSVIASVFPERPFAE